MDHEVKSISARITNSHNTDLSSDLIALFTFLPLFNFLRLTNFIHLTGHKTCSIDWLPCLSRYFLSSTDIRTQELSSSNLNFKQCERHQIANHWNNRLNDTSPTRILLESCTKYTSFSLTKTGLRDVFMEFAKAK